MIYVNLIYNLSLLISISIVSSFINNINVKNRILNQFYQGLLFGGVAIAGMLNPFVLSPGIIFDGRSVVLSLSAFFFGPYAMILSSAMAIVFRFYRGGEGAMTGILVIISSALIGHIYREYLNFRKKEPKLLGIFIMSMAVHVALILLMFTLPPKSSIETIKKIILPILLIYPIASVIISKIFLDREASIKTLNELRHSEFTLQKIFDILPVGLWFADKNGKLLRGNKAGIEIWGAQPKVGPNEYSVFKAKRLSTMEEIEPDDWALSHTIREKVTVENELIEIDAFDGKKKTILNYTAPITDEKGELLGAVIVNQDVTEKMSAEENLKKSERILTETQKMSKIGGWEWDVVNDKMYWTDEVYRIHGISDEDKKSRSYDLIADSIKCYHEKDRVVILNAFNRCLIDGTPYDMRLPFTTYEGKEIFIRTSAYGILDEGKIVRVIGNITDITEQVLAEESIAKEKDRLRVTIQNIGEGVISTDIEGNIVVMNKKAEHMLGIKTSNAIGRKFKEVFKESDSESGEEVKSIIEEALSANSTIDISDGRMIVTANNEKHLISEVCSLIRDKNSKVIGAVVVFSDITDRKKQNEIIQRSDKLNALGTLAGGIAHDFNNLLNGMFGYIELANKFCDNNPRVSGYLDEAMLVFSRAKDLTRQILTFSKGGEPIRKINSISKLITESANFASSGSNVKIKLSIADNLFNCEFDENQMFQVMDNLIINARQAMPLGGDITIEAQNVMGSEVSLMRNKNEDFVKITVRDTGIGISPLVLPHIFDPFFTTKHQGTGLGLATVYSIIKRHDGYVDVESKIDKGTSFYVYLPASKKQISESVDSKSLKTNFSGNVLIMDDEPSIRETTKKLLENCGFDVSCAVNGDEAMNLIFESVKNNYAFNIIILDLTVPGGLGGRDIIDKIRDYNKDVIVIASSGYSEDPVMADPKTFGFTDSIAKPYRINNLTALLSKYLK